MRLRAGLFALAAIAFLAPRPCTAQERGATALGDALEGLPVSVRVLVIAAHPDDEDTRLITWLQKGRHASVAYLSLTRGDGGQNLIGNELGDELGVIRTEELLAARRIDGAQQYFTRAYDFGFSKSAAETYTHWPHDTLLANVVTVVRAFRPQIIIAVFSGTPRDGHGQHQVSGILAREAYDAAGDASRFPSSATSGLAPWTPLKFYRTTSYWQGAGATFHYNAGEYSPLLGMSYSQFGLEGLAHQTSQGTGGIRVLPGHRYTYYRLIDSTLPKPAGHEKDFFEGIDTSLAGLAARLGAEGAARAARLVPRRRRRCRAARIPGPCARRLGRGCIRRGRAPARAARARHCGAGRMRDAAGRRLQVERARGGRAAAPALGQAQRGELALRPARPLGRA